MKKSLLKVLPAGFVEEADAMSPDQLEEVIVSSSNNIRVAKTEMEENTDFQDAKASYKLAAEPFRDAVKAQQAKVQYALELLESKGRL
ncbi:MAG: hypothetical protein WCI01_11755 [Chlorobiaceae bacterium]